MKNWMKKLSGLVFKPLGPLAFLKAQIQFRHFQKYPMGLKNILKGPIQFKTNPILFKNVMGLLKSIKGPKLHFKALFA